MLLNWGTQFVLWLLQKGNCSITQGVGVGWGERTGNAGCHSWESFTFCSLNFYSKTSLPLNQLLQQPVRYPGFTDDTSHFQGQFSGKMNWDLVFLGSYYSKQHRWEGMELNKVLLHEKDTSMPCIWEWENLGLLEHMSELCYRRTPTLPVRVRLSVSQQNRLNFNGLSLSGSALSGLHKPQA